MAEAHKLDAHLLLYFEVIDGEKKSFMIELPVIKADKI